MRARLWWRHRLGVAGGQLRVNLKGFASFPSGPSSVCNWTVRFDRIHFLRCWKALITFDLTFFKRFNKRSSECCFVVVRGGGKALFGSYGGPSDGQLWPKSEKFTSNYFIKSYHKILTKSKKAFCFLMPRWKPHALLLSPYSAYMALSLF